MSTNDYRINAYIKAQGSGAKSTTKAETPKTNTPTPKASDISAFKPMSLDALHSKGVVKKPLFEHISRNEPAGGIDTPKNAVQNSAQNAPNNSQNAQNAQNAAQNVQNAPNSANSFIKTTSSPFSSADAARAAANVAETISRRGFVKVQANPSTAGGESVYRRVAKFLLLVGVDEASKILPHLPQEQVEKIIPEIATIRNVEPDEATVILAEFAELSSKEREGGGINTAKNILEQAFGQEKADEMLKNAVPFADGEPFEYLQEFDGERLFYLLKDESAPVRAIVLSKLKPVKAADVINRMSPEDKKDTVFRLAKLTAVSPDILSRIDHAMHEKAEKIKTNATNSMDGRGALAEILKRMSVDAEKGILSTLQETDPDLSTDLKERLFTMDDVLNADDKFIQTQLRVMSDTDVAYLIAGKSDAFRTKILSDVSKGRGDMILEEEQIKKPMRKSDCDEVTNRFIGSLRRAWENGTLVISGRDEEQYV